MKELPPVKVDVLIIGQGAAGLLAGISLGRDHSVAIVGDRASATSLSTGCISMISQEPEVNGGSGSTSNPWRVRCTPSVI